MSISRARLPLLVAFALAAAACSHATPSGAAVTQTRPATGGFSRIELRGAVDLVVREGRADEAPQVAVRAEPEDQVAITTRVSGDTLIVEEDRGPVTFCLGNCSRTARVEVVLPVLRSVRVVGSGDATVDNAERAGEVDLDLAGSGDVRFRGKADRLRVRVVGSGDATLDGRAGFLEADVSGSGAVDAHGLVATGGVFRVSGSGDVRARLSGGDAKFQVSGSGDITWEGDAHVLAADVSGSGEIKKL